MGDSAEYQSVYCVPIDEKGEEIKENPVLELPLDNIYSHQEATNTLLRLLLNFVGIAILIIMTMFGTPYVYQIFVADIVKKTEWNNDTQQEYNKVSRLKRGEMVAFVIILLTGIFMLTGFSPSVNDQFGAISGVFIITLLFIAFARIQFEKQLKPGDEFYTKYVGNGGSAEFDVDFVKYFSSPFDTEQHKKGYMICGIIVVIEIIITASLYATKTLQPSGSLFIIFWLPFYLTSFFNSMIKEKIVQKE
jgi:hypothetical protein